MMRKNMLSFKKRICCLKCIGNSFLYTANADYNSSWFFDRSFSYSHVKTLIKATLNSLNGKQTLLHVLYCIIESSYITYRLVVLNSVLDIINELSPASYKSYKDTLLAYPLYRNLYSEQGFGNQPLYKQHKQRIAGFKEELITKTWHPSRFVKWCLDCEEQEEFRQPDGSLYETTLYDY